MDEARRTSAFRGSAAGESPEGAARSLGRVNPAMVDKTWGRGRPNLMRQDGSALEGLWAGALDEKGKKNGQCPLTVRVPILTKTNL
jgi:hypothetical protein